jgi:hypothetical protein
MPSLEFGALQTTWAIVALTLFAAFVLSVSRRHRRAGMLLACAAWAAGFVTSGLRSEHLNSDTESYIEYAREAQDTPASEYVTSIRLEPGWALMTRGAALIGLSERGTLMLCAIATMLMLLFALRPLGFLLSLAMMHYVCEFYLMNDLAIIRHSFATAMALLFVVRMSRPDARPSRLRPLTLLVPPFFHVATLSVTGAYLGARGSYVRVAVQALLFSAAAWVLLKVGAGMLPERLIDPTYDANSREVRGFVHMAFLIAIASLDFGAVRSTIETHRNVAFCYLLGVGLSFAVIGFPLLNRLRQVLLEFGILFYPLVIAHIRSVQRLRVALLGYVCFIVAIGLYTVIVTSERYSAGFF